MTSLPGYASTWAYLACCALLVAIAARREGATRTVVVRQVDLESACTAAERLRKRPFEDRERAEFQANWLEERVLVRDARRRGLDRQDPLIRSTVLGGVVRSVARFDREPSREALRAYHANHRYRYVRPETVDLTVTPVEEGADSGSWIGPRLFAMSEVDLRLLFEPVAAAKVFRREPGTWSPAIDSQVGRHRVRVDARDAARERGFDEVVDMVRWDWRVDRERELLEPLLQELRRRYTVEGLGR